MKNLLKETQEVLERWGKTFDDIEWIGDIGNYYYNKEEWKNRLDINYDPERRGVNPGLVVVGKGWWLERVECYGEAWWEFKDIPVKPDMSHEEYEKEYCS